MEYTYSVALLREADGGFSVSVPSLPGCHTQGDSLEEALANAREAIRAYVASLILDCEPIPGNQDDFGVEVEEPTEVLVRHVSVDAGEALVAA